MLAGRRGAFRCIYIDRIAFHFGVLERRDQAANDGIEKLADDVLSVVEFAGGQEGGEARNVGRHQETPPGS